MAVAGGERRREDVGSGALLGHRLAVVAKRAALACIRPPQPPSRVGRLKVAVFASGEPRPVDSKTPADELSREIAAVREIALGHDPVV